VGTPIERAMGLRVCIGLTVNSRVPAKSSRAIFTKVSGLSRSPHWSVLKTKPPVVGSTSPVVGVDSDIWNAPDQLSFAYESLEVAGSVVAQLDAFDAANPAARAGIRSRERLDLDAQFVDFLQTMEPGIRSSSLQWRWRTDGNSTRSVDDSRQIATLPIWLKLERRFSTVTVMANEATLFTQISWMS